MTNPDRTLVFLCVANSSRSQMAEGLARASAPEGWTIFSAGSAPAVLHPMAVEAMAEIDVDISAQKAKGLDDVPIDTADVIVTLCDDEVCPTVPSGAQHLHWPHPDPAAEGDQIRHQFDAFRNVRDDIRQRLDAFWKEQAQ